MGGLCLFSLGVFIFLLPYVAIQIRGVAIFLNATYPTFLPTWGWAALMVVMMLLYSETGGLKAIMFADVLQGLTLLIVIWFIAMNCLNYFGSLENVFLQAGEKDMALLSTPGPKGLFDFHFLLSSFLAILLIPVTQPQITTRLVVMKDLRAMHRMAVAVGVFAMLVIFPTAIIGMYGAVRYPEASTAEFLSNVLLKDQPGIIGAAAIIGLLAAALSTSDSQIFALGSEFKGLLRMEDKKALFWARVAMVVFGFMAMVFSIVTSDQLVLLARVSFAGTSLMAPMIIAAIFFQKPPGNVLVFATLAGILLFVMSQLQWIPARLGNWRMETILLLALGLLAVGLYLNSKNEKNQS